MYRQFAIVSMLVGLLALGTGCCVTGNCGSSFDCMGPSCGPVGDDGCTGSGCNSCGGGCNGTVAADCGGCGECDDCGGCGTGCGGCETSCGGCGGCGGTLGLGISPWIHKSLTCGRGCGSLYVNEWVNDPPSCCDPCDNCGNYVGPRACNPFGWISDGWHCLWGYRFDGCCDGCADGCGDCGGCSDGGCSGCSDCGGGGEISGEMPYYDGQIIEHGATRVVPNSAKSRVATKPYRTTPRTRTVR